MRKSVAAAFVATSFALLCSRAPADPAATAVAGHSEPFNAGTVDRKKGRIKLTSCR